MADSEPERYVSPSNQDLTLAELEQAGFMYEGMDNQSGAVLAESPLGHHVQVRQNGLVWDEWRESSVEDYLEAVGF